MDRKKDEMYNRRIGCENLNKYQNVYLFITNIHFQLVAFGNVFIERSIIN